MYNILGHVKFRACVPKSEHLMDLFIKYQDLSVIYLDLLSLEHVFENLHNHKTYLYYHDIRIMYQNLFKFSSRASKFE